MSRGAKVLEQAACQGWRGKTGPNRRRPLRARTVLSSRQRALDRAVPVRLHFLALVVGDLAGAYNEIGIRRWFERKRAALDRRAPAEALTGAWQPDDPGAVRVRELARALVDLPAT